MTRCASLIKVSAYYYRDSNCRLRVKSVVTLVASSLVLSSDVVHGHGHGHWAGTQKLGHGR